MGGTRERKGNSEAMLGTIETCGGEGETEAEVWGENEKPASRMLDKRLLRG